MLPLLALACFSPESAPTPASLPPAARAVKVALNWYAEPEFGGFFDAAVRGTYAERGLDVELVPGGPGVPVLEMLAAGKVDVAVSGADDLLLRRAQGLDAVAVFPAFQDSPVGLMVHARSGVRRFEDVKGPVAIEAGSPFQQYLWAKYGWEGRVAMVPTTGTVGPFLADPALAQQAYITSEPCVAESQGATIAFLPGRDAGWNPYASLVVVRGADAGAEWVGRFVDASREGWEAYLADPALGNAEIARLNPELSPERLACIVRRQHAFVVGTEGLGSMSEARWTELAAAMRGIGLTVDATGAWKR